ncbi:MAG: zinc ABC transporter substrate-binding protein [Bacillota bacterium]|nr:zinc ABC transporter substrate-binding protein [Bacillota bacterium]
MNYVNKRPCLWVITLLFAFCLTILSGCAQTEAPASSLNTGDSEKLMVAVSIVPQETFVHAVGGDQVEVVTMIPRGNSPANFVPGPQLLTAFSDAALYFSIGVPTEENNILPKIADLNADMKVVDLATRVDAIYPAREFAPGTRDPHMWLSPKRAKEMVRIIADELSALDPGNGNLYSHNAETYIAQLDALDQEISASLKPLKTRKFIVYHPSLGYFADDYGLEMIALEKEGKEASAKDFQRVISDAHKEEIKVIFYQAEIDSKQAQALADELDGEIEMIAPLAPDYIENLKKTARTFARVLD